MFTESCTDADPIASSTFTVKITVYLAPVSNKVGARYRSIMTELPDRPERNALVSEYLASESESESILGSPGPVMDQCMRAVGDA